jgi:excisionase family DNA binding protein
MTPNKPKRSLDLTDELFTVAEVASILKVNQQSVRNWIDGGSIQALRIGRTVRIKRADLQKLLNDGLDVEGEDHVEGDAEG